MRLAAQNRGRMLRFTPARAERAFELSKTDILADLVGHIDDDDQKPKRPFRGQYLLDKCHNNGVSTAGPPVGGPC